MSINKKLKLTLLINAAFSSLSGLSLLFLTKPIAGLMQLQNSILLPIIGGGLLLFALSLIWTATRPVISKAQVKGIIVQDWLWVIGSALIIAFQAFGISMGGYILMGVVALIVADFALIQSWLLRKEVS